MCGRFALYFPDELLAEIFGLPELPGLIHRYNIAPTQAAAVVRSSGKTHKLDLLRWGLVPSWAKEISGGNRMINARNESLPDKPAFRNAVRFRRCVVPASGFYEWKPEGSHKVPYYIRLSDGAPMGFAGIWEAWKTHEGSFLETFAILTTSANPLIATIHDRMPVILHPDAYALWLDKDVSNPKQLQSLYLPYPADLLTLHPVSTLVNSPRNDHPACIEPEPS
ncbi:MAG: SOS response-associated peptidase [Deltaproteobacteria bacterium]|nr:SOS response-associated peptidase [Deltaproteobacteria bacterium]